jgi:hypothetical protein
VRGAWSLGEMAGTFSVLQPVLGEGAAGGKAAFHYPHLKPPVASAAAYVPVLQGGRGRSSEHLKSRAAAGRLVVGGLPDAITGVSSPIRALGGRQQLPPELVDSDLIYEYESGAAAR